MLSEREFEMLLTQYKESLANARNFTLLIWQIPSVAVAVNTFLGLAYLSYGATLEAKMVVLFMGLVFTTVSLLALKKHRFFQESSVADFERAQACLVAEYPNFPEIKLRTGQVFKDLKKYPTVHRERMCRQSSYRWLSAVLTSCILVIGMIMLLEVFITVLG